MRTIGLLGGMSWVSTEHYYRLINADVGARLGPEHCARLTLWQSDFAVIAELQRAGRWADAGEILAEGARALVAAGADLGFPCSTPPCCTRAGSSTSPSRKPVVPRRETTAEQALST